MTSNVTTIAPKYFTLAQEFRRGIKKDKSHYDILKSEKQLNDWKRKVESTATIHGYQNILDPPYMPTTIEEIALFGEQQKFPYDVFISILETDRGKHYVRTYSTTKDAQAVWRDYTNYMSTSTKADLEIETLMAAITNMRLSPSYRGTTTKFVLEWLEKVRQYEEMTPTTAHFPPPMKKAMLQNAMNGMKVFADVKISEELDIAKGRKPIMYDEYATLIQRVATSYDERVARVARSPQYPCSVNETDLQYNIQEHNLLTIDSDNNESDFRDYNDYDAYYSERGGNIENFGSFSVNETRQRGGYHRSNMGYRRPNLSKETWNKLTENDRHAWDRLSDAGKRAIIFMSRAKEGKEITDESIDKRTVSIHDTLPTTDETEIRTMEKDHDDLLVNAASSGIREPQNRMDIRQLLSERKKTPVSKSVSPEEKKKNLNVCMVAISYSVSSTSTREHEALVDRGANGGIAGSNLRVIARTDRTVNVNGIDNHQVRDLSIVTVGGVITTQRGPVVAIFHQMAHSPMGKTIISSPQLEAFKNKVDDRSIAAGGEQCIRTLDGYIIPLHFHQGLAYLKICSFTDEEYDKLPHIVMTSDSIWDPTVMDVERNNISWLETQPDVTGVEPIHEPFDSTEEYMTTSPDTSPVPVQVNWAALEVDCLTNELDPELNAHVLQVHQSKKDFDQLKKYFLFSDSHVIQHTFKNTTQFARHGWVTGRIWDTHRAPFPALNVRRRNEPVATDTIFADVPALGTGATCAQFFVGCSTSVCDVFGMRTDSQFVSRLLDVIRTRGAMDQLISDRAQVEISNKVLDILRHLCIDDWQSEPHYQHQNFAERRYREVKHKTNRVLNVTGAPANMWLLCMEYVCFILNRMSLRSKNWKTPLELLNGETPDISMIYRFCFWEKVYFINQGTRRHENFPSESDECVGRFVGFSENVGHKMTYKVLNLETNRVIYRSRIRLAEVEPNFRVDLPPSEINERASEEDEKGATEVEDPVSTDEDDRSMKFVDEPDVEKLGHVPGEEDREVVRTNERPMALLDPDELVGRIYLSVPSEDGTRMRMRVTECLNEMDRRADMSNEMRRFHAENSDREVEEIITYNDLLDRLEEGDGEDGLWKFTSINSHKGPLKPTNPEYRGSQWNVRVQWENGESTWEPLEVIAKSDPVTCAIYAKRNDLLEQPGWKRFKRIAKRQKRFVRLVNQAKLKAYRNKTIYKFGVQVPNNHEHAMELDRKLGNSLWAEAEAKEFDQINDYSTFKDLGKGGKPPPGYKKINVHLVYDVKHDGRRKARLVAGGHLTGPPLESVYSGVVSLRGLRLVLFIAELNGLEIWSTDVGNAYLEAETREKVYIIGGPEFKEREGHTLIIVKALYGLKLSGKMWGERCSDILQDMGYIPSKTEDDIWMRDLGDHYEYIARYVDDLALVSRNPQKIIDKLEETYKLKLKGTGPIGYHLGCDFFRDTQGVLCMCPKRYIEKMITNYEMMFGCKPNQKYLSPLERNDHPELDTSEELEVEGIKKYQGLIGAIQWSVSIGRMDVATAVMTMSKFRAAPRKGHLERVRRIVGYLAKMKYATIRFRVGKPDMLAYKKVEFGWERSVYGDVSELVPNDAPEQKGPEVTMITFVDANLMHDVVSGKSVTGVVHMLNRTPIDFYSKKQSTVETATYGSEFVAARTATEQIMDLRLTLRYLGVRIETQAYMFGDNDSVVKSSTIPHAKLHKRHVLLSFHRVREAIASKMLSFHYIPGNLNPADILSKAWGYQQIWNILKPLMFWEGDTADLVENRDAKEDAGTSDLGE